MADLQEAMANPFSQEKAWVTFQENMASAERLQEEIRQGQAEGNLSEREMLLKATEALGKMTDNTILLRVVQRALEERDA